MICSPEHFFVSPDGLLGFSMLAQVISTRISQPSLPRKNMNLHYSICLFWTNFWQPTVHVQKNIFEKTFIEVGSSYLFTSFGTFWVQIGQLVEAQWDFKLLETSILPFSYIFQRLTVPRIIDQFGLKRCLKKRKYVSYQLL